jgi:hypothetical protein
MWQFSNGGQRVAPHSASRYRFFRGGFGSRLDIEINVETASSFFQLIDNRVLSRPGNDKFDFSVYFALFQVLGPPPVEFWIDLGVYH